MEVHPSMHNVPLKPTELHDRLATLSPVEAAMGCHGCHAKAENDSVFVSLSMKESVTPETPDMWDAGDAAADANGGTDGADANGGDAQ